jgi:hypothetical protein
MLPIEYIRMTINEHDEKEYLTLKQASERFGYSPDYIGQLIRKGKIEGKQIVANVAWVTTEDAMREYIAGLSPVVKNSAPSMFARLTDILFAEKGLAVLVWVLRGAIVLLVLSGLLVFYFLSIAINEQLAVNAEEALERRIAEQTLHIPSAITSYPPVAYGE